MSVIFQPASRIPLRIRLAIWLVGKKYAFAANCYFFDVGVRPGQQIFLTNCRIAVPKGSHLSAVPGGKDPVA